MNNNPKITVEAVVNAPIEKVWATWTTAADIAQWNNASPDWHTPKADLDLRPGGKFNYRMEAKDGSFGFDFGGEFDIVEPNQYLEYTIGDGRKVRIDFAALGNKTAITETFDAETVNSPELQKTGWQAILDSFKKYAENN